MPHTLKRKYHLTNFYHWLHQYLSKWQFHCSQWRKLNQMATFPFQCSAWGLCHTTHGAVAATSVQSLHGPLTRYVKLRVAHAPGMPGTFSPPPRVSDADMHHGTCVAHVPWCMSGSLTSGFLWSRWRGKRSRHSRRMRNPQFCVSGKRPMTTSWHGNAFWTTSLLALCGGNHYDTDVMQNFYVFCAVSLNKLLHYLWFETRQRSCDVTLMQSDLKLCI